MVVPNDVARRTWVGSEQFQIHKHQKKCLISKSLSTQINKQLKKLIKLFISDAHGMKMGT